MSIPRWHFGRTGDSNGADDEKWIFAILRTLLTISHQDRWCTFRLKKRLCLSLMSDAKHLSCLFPQARIFSPSVIWRALWNGRVTSACKGSAPSSTSVWRFPLQSTSSPRLWTVRPVRFQSRHYWHGCLQQKSCSISRIAIGSFLKYHYGFADDVKEYLLTDQPCWHPTKITDALHAAEQNHVCSHYLVV